MKMKHNNITAQGIKISADLRKYKPLNSLSFGYPQKFYTLKIKYLYGIPSN